MESVEILPGVFVVSRGRSTCRIMMPTGRASHIGLCKICGRYPIVPGRCERHVGERVAKLYHARITKSPFGSQMNVADVEELFATTQRCHLCDVPLIKSIGLGCLDSVSLDRNARGPYQNANVRVTCKLCNLLRGWIPCDFFRNAMMYILTGVEPRGCSFGRDTCRLTNRRGCQDMRCPLFIRHGRLALLNNIKAHANDLYVMNALSRRARSCLSGLATR
jgi:hypothetical protein